MQFILQRFSDNRESTLGLLFSKKYHESKPTLIFECYVLEDEFRLEKLKGETRIPAGEYKLGIQNQLTDLTQKYRLKYPWFKNHIQIMDVPGFTGIYIHIGNTDKDTDGCLLLGDNADNNRLGGGSVSNSTQAFKRFYSNYYELIELGSCTIEIRDENKMI